MIRHLDNPLVLAGAGKMGQAMLAGWLERGLDPTRVVIQEPNADAALSELARRHDIALVNEIREVAPPSVVVMAVKPQVMADVIAPLAKFMAPHTVVMSIAAGKSLASFAAHLPDKQAVVRAMPNTPASIGRGMTGAVANAHVSKQQKELCDDLLSAVGEVVWLENEALIDAVTAVSGSGPAYVFYMVEALAKAGEDAGLDAETAMKLARGTVSGAGELLNRQASIEAQTLRQNVTSPGGTTAAALAVLMREKNGLQVVLTEAVAAAKKRSRELGQ